MLINSLTAENFRKYHKLEVTDIPANGVITIAGKNESGKTSIGEAICFALFGRTFSLDKNNLHKVICWGRDTAEVTLAFTDGAGERYSLYRNLHRDGTSKINLHREVSEGLSDYAQVELDTEEVVADALSKILGFDYDAFANSFYLAQRELTTPDPNSETIKKMAGIGDYANITNELIQSNEENEKRIVEITPEIDSSQSELDAINLDEEWLPELIDAEQTLGIEQQRREALVDHLNDNGQSYTTNVGKFQSAGKTSSFMGFLTVLSLPVMIVSWFAYVMSKYYPESFDKLLDTISIKEQFSAFSDYIIPVAIISMLVLLLSLFLQRKANETSRQLNEEASEFGISLSEGHRYITTDVETLLPERVVQRLYESNSEKKSLLITPPREQFANLVQLTEDTQDYKAPAEEITAAVTRLSDALKKQDTGIHDIGEGLLADIDKEKIRSDEAGKLRSALKVLTTAVSKCQNNIDVQNVSMGLLQRAAKDSIELFNSNIAEISANTLPKFTEGRYSEVSIAEDLSVQVYSDEKKGYMDFDEISSGTQRQIMLALRMAMSEELSKNTGNEQQFIFLDEPFAFFDQARTKSTLRALPDVSKVIAQIWIVAQEFPMDVEVSKAINCPSDSAELLV